MRYSTWQIALILLVAALGVVFTLPNFIGRTTLEKLPDWLPKRQITLGLDLQGGSYLLLEVDTNALVKDKLDNLVGDIRAKLRQARIGYRGLGVQGDTALVTLTDPKQLRCRSGPAQGHQPMMPAAGFGGHERTAVRHRDLARAARSRSSSTIRRAPSWLARR